MTRRPRTAICPGCGHPQSLAGGRLVAHHTDGTPMPVAHPDYQRMCPWTLTRPDADHPASAGAARAARPARSSAGEREQRALTETQLDLLELLDDAGCGDLPAVLPSRP